MRIDLEGMSDPRVFRRDNGNVRIDARGLHHRELNAMVKQAALDGATFMEIDNVYGQAYIGSGVRRPVHIEIHGDPGNDLGALMDGPKIVVYRDAQDGVGNTMNDGSIVVHGRAGDMVAMGMRGGSIFICGSVGHQAAIHMKERIKRRPALVIGGSCRDFLGEYMAGGVVVVLGLDRRPGEAFPARHVGAGMHGGIIFLRGGIDPQNLGRGVVVTGMEEGDRMELRGLVERFCGHFGGDPQKIMADEFLKLTPRFRQPYSGFCAP